MRDFFSNPSLSWRRDLLLLFLAIGAFFCIGLGVRPYLTPSEARYIELPRQMLISHDFLTPRIDGVPYFEKPPLFYWMQAAIMGPFGLEEFAGRSATLLIVTGICLLTYAIGRMAFGRLSGLLAAGLLASSLLGYGLSRIAMLDAPVTLFLTASIGAFFAAQHAANEKTKRNCYWLIYVAAALAVLTKGLIGMLVPGLVIGGWIAATGSWRILKEARLLSGSLIFLLIAAPWHVVMAHEHPDFLQFYFIHEHFARYLTDEHKRMQPWWFFIVVTLGGLLPWTGILPSALKSLKSKVWPLKNADADMLFLVLWVLLPLLFFSASHSKLVPYIFPIFPPLAIILGNRLAAMWQGAASAKPLRNTALLVALLFGGALLAYRLVPIQVDPNSNIGLDGISFWMLAPIIVGLCALLYALLIKVSPPVLIGALLCFAAVVDIDANYLIADADRATIKPLANIIDGHIKKNDMVVAYGTYFQDLPVYLNRRIIVTNWDGELSFGVEHYPETKEWMITSDELWERCAASKHAVFVFMKISTLTDLEVPKSCAIKPLQAFGKNVLMEVGMK